METATWITMLLITGFVWGGFAFILATALRKEAGKRDEAAPRER
jgi:hypothetical protein